MELLSTFIADLEMKVLEGRREIGSIAPLSLTAPVIEGRKPLLLAGRAWRVEDVDWERHVVAVREDLREGTRPLGIGRRCLNRSRWFARAARCCSGPAL